MGGIQHHIDYAFDLAIQGAKISGVQPKHAGNGRSNGLPVKVLAFNLAGFLHVLCKDLKCGFFLH